MWLSANTNCSCRGKWVHKDRFIEKVTKPSSVLLLDLVTFSMNQSLIHIIKVSKRHLNLWLFTFFKRPKIHQCGIILLLKLILCPKFSVIIQGHAYLQFVCHQLNFLLHSWKFSVGIELFKDQIISKGLFVALKFSQKTNERIRRSSQT